MSRIIRFSLTSLAAVLILYACSFPWDNPTPEPPAVFTNLRLTKSANPTTYNQVGQVISYAYAFTNAGTAPLTGPVTIADDKAPATCPNLNTIGNLDNNLDPNETITCTSTYSITQADLNAGSVTNTATASVGGQTSGLVQTTVRTTENKVLTLTKSASPTTYSQAGQVITYTYAIKNSGTTALGPAQFTVRDDHISAPINCGSATTTIQPNETISCNASYTISQNDMTLAQLTNNATASGAGAGSIQAATVTITNTTPPTVTPSPGNYKLGDTVTHKVTQGEWLIQIARCWGADYNEVLAANRQISDPSYIVPDMLVTVPHIGSKGTIYFPQCFDSYTVPAGEKWDAVAQKFNANEDVLKAANWKVTLPSTSAQVIRVPRGTTPSSVTPPPVSNAIRINFPAGTTTVTLNSSVNAQAKVRYVIAATQGQTLSVKVTGPANELALAVFAPNGSTLKSQDTTLTWTATVASTGDHTIEIVGIAGTSPKAFTLEVSLTTPAAGPVLERVADINAGAVDSNPSYLAGYGGVLYFQATGGDNTGPELWKYDSALKAASRVADINVGPGGSDPGFLVEHNGVLYFRANGNDGAGSELWRYSSAGVSRAADINNGAGSSNPSYLTVFRNALYFSANGNDGMGVELWKFDGANASRVADIYNGAGDSSPAYLTVFNDALYFSAISNDGAGIELWKFDGTNATRVTDLNQGVGSSNPAYMEVFKGALYFSANANDGSGTELWKYDGTNTVRASDINGGPGDSVPSYLTDFNGALYFAANGNDGAGYELWRYDGANVSRVTDINKSGDSTPAFLAVVNNELFFQANGNDGAGKELWRFKP